MDPAELGFTPQRPVPWLAPLLLLRTGLRSLLAILFGNYLDKRELQNSLPSHVHTQPGVDGELWLDYVADLGDGFNATYSVAYLLAQRELTPPGTPDGRPLPRGHLLLMGGDQVYPTADMQSYEDRMKGPYVAALPCPPRQGPRPTLYALPGNHDWYDGLTSFLRLFVRVRTDNVGGWCTEQSRSYFAVELPHHWWLFGIDEQFGSYLDDPQLAYFERAANRLRPGDQVILAVPAPTWLKAVDRPRAYDTVDYFVRTVLDPAGVRLRVIVTGDLHHYARYADIGTGLDHAGVGDDGTRVGDNEDPGEVGRQLITCGGGGAYLYPTHKLPEAIAVPPRDTITRRRSPSRDYALRARYPEPDRSRRFAWGVFGRLPWRNPGFVGLLGGLHTVLMLMIAAFLVGRISGTEQRLFSIPLVVVGGLVLLAAFLFAAPPTAGSKRRARHAVLGLLHGACHLAIGALGAWLWAMLPFLEWPWPWPPLVAVAVYGPVSGLLASQVVSLYLLVAGSFGVNLNELFAAQGIEDAKSFLRLHIATDGTLTIYPMAVDRICRRWRPAPDGAPDAPWFEPAEPLTVRLAEPPVVLSPLRGPDRAGQRR